MPFYVLCVVFLPLLFYHFSSMSDTNRMRSVCVWHFRTLARLTLTKYTLRTVNIERASHPTRCVASFGILSKHKNEKGARLNFHFFSTFVDPFISLLSLSYRTDDDAKYKKSYNLWVNIHFYQILFLLSLSNYKSSRLRRFFLPSFETQELVINRFFIC